MPSKDSCLTCRYFFAVNADTGLCQRNPPVAIAVARGHDDGRVTSSIGAYQPIIDAKTWCGEYRSRLAAAVGEKLNS